MPDKINILNSVLSLGFSPCPNDTFIFDALVHGRIPLQGIRFQPFLDDVETLNQKALKSDPDITKISYRAYPEISDRYQLLTSGGALGRGVGPLLIAGSHLDRPREQIRSVAIPGIHTTANFLFGLFYPEIQNRIPMVFSDIENAVLSGKTDAGVIIHENRFTYAGKGLHKIADLGELWEQTSGHPLPLGGIAIRRDLPEDLKRTVNRLVRESVAYAFAHPLDSRDYVALHAQEIDPSVRQQHIDLYVNEYSVDLGAKGKSAVTEFFRKALETGTVQNIHTPYFVEDPT